MLHIVPHWELYSRLIIAVVFGTIIGFERACKGKSVGIRTHSLVCVGSALAMVLSSLNDGRYRDPMRLAAQVISGIGFIGAGVIWTDRSNVKRGLTTAANLWITATLGLAIGYGAFDLAIVTLLCMFFAINIPRMLGVIGIDMRKIQRKNHVRRKQDEYEDD